MGVKNDSTRAKRALRVAFISLYKDLPIEKIGVNKVAELSEYSRSVFYFHYQDIYELLQEIEDSFLDYVGDFYDFKDSNTQIEIEQLRIPQCTVRWFERALEYRDFLTGALSDHGNRLFEVHLRKKLAENFLTMARREGVPDDDRTRLMMEYQTEGLIGLLRYSTVRQLGEQDAEELAKVVDTMRNYWHFANKKMYQSGICK